MNKAELLVVFPTYGNLPIVRETLPAVIDEVLRTESARLIVHDSTEVAHGQSEKWDYLRELQEEFGYFLLLSTNLSMAHARNMCLQLGQELYAPEAICMLEDDHGLRPGALDTLRDAMREHYGKRAPNGLLFGLFTCCERHSHAQLDDLRDGIRYPKPTAAPFGLGAANSCFRCAPASHWYSVLKGYDLDEYLISNFQTAGLGWRNYHRGFTVAYVGGGELAFAVEAPGRGEGTAAGETLLWDRVYCKSDPRSVFRGKTDHEVQAARNLRKQSGLQPEALERSPGRWLKRLASRIRRG